jgi:hypothetical protein
LAVNQHRTQPHCLPRDQHIVSSYRSSSEFQVRPHSAGKARVLIVERREFNWSRKKSCETERIRFLPGAFRNSVPQLESHDRGYKHFPSGRQLALQSASHLFRPLFDDRNDGVCVEEIPHSKMSRTGVGG